MKTSVKSVRVDDRTVKEIEQLRKGNEKTFSSLAGELLSEAAKMRRCPGIVFGNGPSGRRARIEGTGVEAWEIIASYLALKEDAKRLRKAYPWLSDRQILAALGYFRAYPEEIKNLIDANRSGGSEIIDEQLPFARRASR